MKFHLNIRHLLMYIVVCVLLVLGVGVWDMYREKNYSILYQNVYKSSILNFTDTNLTSGKTLEGEFVATENNLGIVAIRFNNFNRINKDRVLFRLKEKNAPNWYYSAIYNSKELGGYEHFPFGFPVIKDSKGKSYAYEIQSIDGTLQNSVAVFSSEPIGIIKYKFSYSELSSDLSLAASLFFKKITYSLAKFENIVLIVKLFLALNLIYFLGKIFNNMARNLPLDASEINGNSYTSSVKSTLKTATNKSKAAKNITTGILGRLYWKIVGKLSYFYERIENPKI